MPTPRGRSVVITAFVDASHAANKVMRRSHTGYVVVLNRAPVVWFSNRQNTVETSTFSAEFIALKVCLEAIEHYVVSVCLYHEENHHMCYATMKA